MLEKVNLDRKLPHADYKRALPGLQRRLYDLEKACWEHRVASVVVFEGWDAAGKGSAIRTLTERLDPRGFKLPPTAKWPSSTRAGTDASSSSGWSA